MIRAVYSYLASDSDLSIALETATGESPAIWYGVAPQGAAYPFIVCNRLSETPDQTSLSSRGHSVQAWQFDIYAENYVTAYAVESALNDLIDRPGELFDITAAGTTWGILNARRTDTTDASDFETDATETKIKRLMVEAEITAVEKAPETPA